MRVAILQYGDYAEAVLRFAQGGPETYYAQKYSVEAVAALTARAEDVSVVCFAKESPEVRLPNGVRAVGVQLYPPGGRARHLTLIRTLYRLRPDHLIVISPQPLVIAWALARGIRVLPMFADSFHARDLRSRLRYLALVRLLNSRRIEWVSNHNLAASLDLVRIGVDEHKVVPFDWPAFVRPEDRPAKQRVPGTPFKVAYVGMVTEAKGVGDLLAAVKILNADGAGPRFSATVVGGHDGVLERRAAELGIAGQVTFAGRVPHDQIVALMNQHDAVVIPSRHEYPEGLPMTIYEAICSRSPLVASDHPMFKLKLAHERTALLFPASRPEGLAAQLRRLEADPALYARLSQTAISSGADYFCPLKYHELITRWLDGGEQNRQVLASYSIGSGAYSSSRRAA